MIKIYPNFVSSEEIDSLLETIDWSEERPYPAKQTNLTFICPVKNKINKKAKELGNLINAELLIYREKCFSIRHIDEYDYNGDFQWVMTGILMLIDPLKYTGGQLVFNDLNISMKLPKGTLITFPAGPDSKDYYHSVKEVTSGQRNVLVYRFTK
jgi:predicted 2-oxoglutarate/Fe(II)-dependent dioxygenase YbiX